MVIINQIQNFNILNIINLYSTEIVPGGISYDMSRFFDIVVMDYIYQFFFSQYTVVSHFNVVKDFFNEIVYFFLIVFIIGENEDSSKSDGDSKSFRQLYLRQLYLRQAFHRQGHFADKCFANDHKIWGKEIRVRIRIRLG
jgi:hypothetical protein